MLPEWNVMRPQHTRLLLIVGGRDRRCPARSIQEASIQRRKSSPLDSLSDLLDRLSLCGRTVQRLQAVNGIICASGLTSGIGMVAHPSECVSQCA